MSYKAYWIGDCIVRAIVDEYGFFTEEKEKEPFYMKEEDLKRIERDLAALALRDPKTYADLVPKVFLTDYSIRDMLGKRLTNADIFSLVKEFVGTVVDRRSRKKITEDGDRWLVFGQLDNICKVNYLETGRFSARNRHPEHAYKFIFDRAASIDFWNSVRLGLFDCRPPSYYRLKGGSQLIYRAIGWTDKPSHLELKQLCRIAKIKTKNVTWQQRYIESYLDELKASGFIRDWKKRIKKKSSVREIWYDIRKIKRLPKK